MKYIITYHRNSPFDSQGEYEADILVGDVIVNSTVKRTEREAIAWAEKEIAE